MSGFTTQENVASARKQHRCDWCGEKIEVGQPYSRWRSYENDDPMTVRVHPECLVAIKAAALIRALASRPSAPAPAIDVADICNAYESGVGHNGRPTANVNPYPVGSHEHEAYRIGATGTKHNGLSAPAQDAVRDAKVGAAIERAARELPFGYDISIEIERGAGTVRLYGPDCEEIRLDFDGDTFAGEINTAVDTALTIHQHNLDADAMQEPPRAEFGYE